MVSLEELQALSRLVGVGVGELGVGMWGGEVVAMG